MLTAGSVVVPAKEAARARWTVLVERERGGKPVAVNDCEHEEHIACCAVAEVLHASFLLHLTRASQATIRYFISSVPKSNPSIHNQTSHALVSDCVLPILYLSQKSHESRDAALRNDFPLKFT